MFRQTTKSSAYFGINVMWNKQFMTVDTIISFELIVHIVSFLLNYNY